MKKCVVAISAAFVLFASLAQVGCCAEPATAPTTKPAAVETLPKWEKEIRAFEKSDAESMPAPGGIVFVGSSTIVYWDIPKAFAELPYIKRGFGGSQMADSARFVKRIVTKYRPKVVVLYAGENDIADNLSPEATFKAFSEFKTVLHTDCPDTKLVYIAAKPSVARAKHLDRINAYNALVRDDIKNDAWVTYFDPAPLLTDEKGQPKLELYRPDKLHMNEAGYAIVNEKIKPVITALYKN